MSPHRSFPSWLPAAIAALFLTSAAVSRAGTWTNSVGRTFEANFVRLHGTDVIFTTPAGRKFSTPLTEMSVADQNRLRNGTPANRTRRPNAVSIKKGAAIPAGTSNLGWSWPREVKLSGSTACKTISEDAKARRFIYECPGYRFTCDARITSDALRNFSVLFETTREYAKMLPLSMKRSGPSDKRNILLFGETKDYTRAGGPLGSAGVFMPSTGAVMVPMSSLGLVKGNTGYSLNPKRQNNILIHELAHQLTPDLYFAPGVRGWFSEGLAEYMAVTPYNWGYFRSDPHGNVVMKYVSARGNSGTGGRNLGTKITVPPLKDFFRMDYRIFAGRNANSNYGAGLLLVHYFFHMEGGGKAKRITRYLKGLHAGARGDTAFAPLLGGGSFKSLQSDITAAWSKKGIQIQFKAR